MTMLPPSSLKSDAAQDRKGESLTPSSDFHLRYSTDAGETKNKGNTAAERSYAHEEGGGNHSTLSNTSISPSFHLPPPPPSITDS